MIKRIHFQHDVTGDNKKDWVKFIKDTERFCNNVNIISISEYCIHGMYNIVVWYRESIPD